MKKSHFITLIISMLGILTLGLGMCMCLISEWNMLNTGIIVGCIGLLILFIALIVYRKMEKKEPIRITPKAVFSVILVVAGALILGTGMCMTMLYDQMVFGTIVGIIGIILLIMLIPVTKGLK
ncbi:MAG: hypothetical protein RR585_15775 [Coprobacillus sp.]